MATIPTAVYRTTHPDALAAQRQTLADRDAYVAAAEAFGTEFGFEPIQWGRHSGGRLAGLKARGSLTRERKADKPPGDGWRYDTRLGDWLPDMRTMAGKALARRIAGIHWTATNPPGMPSEIWGLNVDDHHIYYCGLEERDNVLYARWSFDPADHSMEIHSSRLGEGQELHHGTRLESPTQKQAAADAFTRGDSRLLVMSLRAGAGLDGLQQCASVAVFGELDWSPAMHDQCIGRLARDGQDATVAAYFLVADDGADPVIADVLELKRQQAEPIRNPDQPLLLEASDKSSDRIRLLAEAAINRGRG